MTDENKDCAVSDSIDELLVAEEETSLATTSSLSLSDESKALINQIIAETDEKKAKDLTYLFNINQNKKTMVRVNKLSDLLDTITDQALTRFTDRPDEISNKELFDGLKVVQDLIERGQKQVSGAEDVPLIQVNQQTNEVNIGGSTSTLSRDSRERVKAAVLDLLGNITAKSTAQIDDNIIVVDEIEGDDNNGE